MMHSIWEAQAQLPQFEPLIGDQKTDVLIIGGGLCGLLCAYFLQQAGVEYILVEGNRIASGITKNTTAKITAQHGLIYQRLWNSVGREQTKMYLSANLAALAEYERLCSTIACDFEKQPAYVYSRTKREKIETEVKILQQLGVQAEFCGKTALPFAVAGAVRFPEQAQFHPLKFLAAIAKGLHIYEQTMVREIGPHTAVTAQGTIHAKKLIVATHFPFINKHGSYFLKLYQHRSYVAAFSGCPDLQGMYVDEAEDGMSFRNYGDMLFIGGGGHRTGKQGSGWTKSYEFAQKYYPDTNLEQSWATQDCMSLDGVPYIGRYSARTPDLYVASGFNKWGVTSSMAAAQLLRDMVLGRETETAPVFSPQRSILKPQLFLNGVEAVANLLTPTPKRCPHLGCALKWNRAEHSWDCPCHGSRFEADGALIDNPATGDAKID